MRKKIILKNNQAPGDVLMLTAAVRELATLHHERFYLDVRTPYPDLWRYNPYITSIHDEDSDAEIIECEYPLIHSSNQTTHHFIDGFRVFLENRLNISIPLRKFKGDLHLAQIEKQEQSVIENITGQALPFWIINAGGKYDFTAKCWHTERYQQVVDALAGKVLFAQTGKESDDHPHLKGVINLIGKTNIRELIKLTYHADGVLTPISFPMHLAAATPTKPHKPRSRACVVIAGGREPMQWEAYPTHQFLHTVGMLDCCRTGGCWKSRSLPLGDGDSKDEPVNLCSDLVNKYPRCLDMITPQLVIEHLMLYYHGNNIRLLSQDEWQLAKPHLSEGKRTIPNVSVNPPDNPIVTICVLSYGDYPTLIQRCIESINQCCDRSQYRLLVGANAVSDETRQYLKLRESDGVIDQIIWCENNINKCPMMKLMFENIATDYIWWFDDDSYIGSKNALERRICEAETADENTVMWGDMYCVRLADFSKGTDVEGFVKSASWYAGLPLHKNQEDWQFIAGGNWFVRTKAVQKIDWPDHRMIKAADDVLLCEAFRQQGMKIANIGECGVYVNTAERRGAGEDYHTMKQQMQSS